ncbi:ABC transporter permease [Cocleimonas flava]|uniref:Putative ABC transport system permease protein n=1 Tax=Cocleimonas flava TaxID=634765 RepID=A0A4R1EU30_9GAMM|nr:MULTISPECIES: ABC transporter permease [Cocleimonas]MEB8433534.1 ABC transporter permease [Cocleimonas sp. KMM 6892]MEC4716345.1 ABC transporter permease [Cocleimonas sp. KMM 6895]MEC4745762.1 ABC transporter permease [Cocleimonas sp. KMM 6896]TCJ85176.1 putative ABC transport system permease protein [Cocleimonas flava]
MKLLKIAFKSAANRKTGLILASVSIALSIMLLLVVDTIRKQGKSSFVNTISQTDLVVGARSGPLNLLMYSVFRIGNATNNVSWKSYQEIAAFPETDWTVPLSLGDSHKGFRVLGTNQDYFKYYRFAGGKNLAFAKGKQFDDLYDAVLGSEVAKKLSYKLGDKITLAHGLTSTKFAEHGDKPFRVSGILERTGTPVDQTVHVSLQAIEAIHVDWLSGSPSPIKISAEKAREMKLNPKTITAFMLGLKNRTATFRMQRKINQYRAEPLLAILPGSTLAILWNTLGNFEKILVAIAFLVLLSGLLGMLTTLLSTLNERRREMAILRTVGAHAWHIIALFLLEAFMVVLGGCILGLIASYVVQLVAQPLLVQLYGIHIDIMFPDAEQWAIIGGALLLGLFFSLLPGLIAYRRSLQDGLVLKV